MADKKCILIADDDRFIRNLLSKRLSAEGYDVTVVTNSDDVMKTLSAGNYDALITDIYMETMSGLEMIPVIKKLKPGMPIIAMTGDETVGLEREVRSLGVFAYFLKPLEMQIMVKTVKAAVASTAVEGRVRYG